MWLLIVVMVVVCRYAGEGNVTPWGWLRWCRRVWWGLRIVWRGWVGMFSQLSYSTARPTPSTTPDG